MCFLEKEIKNKTEYTGYKIVAKKQNRDYYSIAMGFEYKEDEDIPIVKKQEVLSDMFRDSILEGPCHNPDMRGRTAVFRNKKDAGNFFRNIPRFYCVYQPVIVRATVKKDLMSGTYSFWNVVAGRRIKFHEEIK
uniref:Uncharacterized protein n=1 Tax=viral metagenome TaxID=1070528 RepID=A0A6M3XDK3_9ZZZZ